MLRPEKAKTQSPSQSKIVDFRADWASPTDFCKIFENDMDHLYLLAFLMTANHQNAEQCFTATVHGAFSEQSVFKAWAASWVKRTLIKNAIEIASPTPARGIEKRDTWSVDRNGAPGDNEIDAVTRLAPVERFVFVMSILERYSDRECSLLLGCSIERVAQIRLRALRGLPVPAALLPRTEVIASRNQQIPA
jgi:DNA-directed RNA polymerase specialized sigma24 family protein